MAHREIGWTFETGDGWHRLIESASRCFTPSAEAVAMSRVVSLEREHALALSLATDASARVADLAARLETAREQLAMVQSAGAAP